MTIAIPVGISSRHIHLTAEAVEVLFGPGHELRVYKPLSQPGEFAAVETVNLVGPKATLKKVRVLGPVRSQTQVEISKTDGYILGIRPPIRESGHLEDTPGIVVQGPAGELALEKGVIVAQRHIHATPEDAQRLGVKDSDLVAVKCTGKRALIFENVIFRVKRDWKLEMHMDTDEANAANLRTGDLVELWVPGE